MASESDELEELAVSIEGFTVKKPKKKKKKKKSGGTRVPEIEKTTEDPSENEDDDDDDDLWRLAQGKIKGGNKTKSSLPRGGEASQKSPDIPAHIAASMQAAQSMQHDQPGGAVGTKKKKGSKAQERLAALKREYDSLVAASSDGGPEGNDHEEAVQRVLHLSEVSARLEVAQAAVEAEAKKKSAAAKMFNPADLLGLTESSLKAHRAASDTAPPLGTPLAGSAAAAGLVVADTRLVSSFVLLRAAALREEKEEEEDAARRGFVATGLGDGDGNQGRGSGGGVYPIGITRPETRTEHERILRVARKVVCGGSAGGGALEASLLENKAMFDKNFAFLKPHHPLHAYYQGLRCLAPAHLDGLVASSEHESSVLKACLAQSVEALRKELHENFAAPAGGVEEGGEEARAAARTQYLGQRMYPLVQMWTAHRGEELAGKLTGMILALPEDDILPLLVKPEALKDATEKAMAALQEHEAEGASPP
mmetsp:Transcript_21836/g.36913  ORF Transcript_21836/g.36913 Transcript_21836/m.36913 type:complete len:480 (-) Transcript_21836:477-1916(-)|eukprot:CAMPEP_0171769438 /NCGR_PEP_ID=MMETSP0991-20121206/52948_1 /TAXON_ID=483369 /ORGANISM="non described non described, Strain CCMP2098" /LENGTH=479 /DNA_ID=CAMNT_0012374485 /DNA_START=33 /DNA_END=1472 /DNA_ORIENTATION=-